MRMKVAFLRCLREGQGPFDWRKLADLTAKFDVYKNTKAMAAREDHHRPFRLDVVVGFGTSGCRVLDLVLLCMGLFCGWTTGYALLHVGGEERGFMLGDGTAILNMR